MSYSLLQPFHLALFFSSRVCVDVLLHFCLRVGVVETGVYVCVCVLLCRRQRRRDSVDKRPCCPSARESACYARECAVAYCCQLLLLHVRALRWCVIHVDDKCAIHAPSHTHRHTHDSRTHAHIPRPPSAPPRAGKTRTQTPRVDASENTIWLFKKYYVYMTRRRRWRLLQPECNSRERARVRCMRQKTSENSTRVVVGVDGARARLPVAEM